MQEFAAARPPFRTVDDLKWSALVQTTQANVHRIGQGGGGVISPRPVFGKRTQSAARRDEACQNHTKASAGGSVRLHFQEVWLSLFEADPHSKSG